MKIVVMKSKMISKKLEEYLEKYGEDVVYITEEKQDLIRLKKTPFSVLCLNKKANTLDSKRNNISEIYKLLTVYRDVLLKVINCEDVIFLTDMFPESLLAFKLIQSLKSRVKIHLCLETPIKFLPQIEIERYIELVADLSKIRSVFYINTNEYGLTKKIGDVMDSMDSRMMATLPRIIKNVNNLEKKEEYIFDFVLEKYVLKDEAEKKILSLLD